MNPNFAEALAKAAQAAQMFRDDLREVYHNAATCCEEIVFMDMLKQANEIVAKLVRLDEEAQKVKNTQAKDKS